MNKETIVVFGASGLVGGQLSKLLSNNGYLVRETTSKKALPSDQKKVHVDLSTGEGIHSALKGADKAFLLSPPGYADQYKILSPIIQEAKRVGLKKVVLMTAMGANADDNTPFRKAEIELEKSGLSYNIIRPNWFFQNFNTFWIQVILEQNKIQLPAGNAKTSFIDARDISDVAYKLLTTDTFNNMDFDITGPIAYDHFQIAKAISNVTGRNITYSDISPEFLKEGLISAGLPNDYVDFLIMIFSFLKAGYNSGVNDNVKKLIGREPKNLEDYVGFYKDNWIKF